MLHDLHWRGARSTTIIAVASGLGLRYIMDAFLCSSISGCPSLIGTLLARFIDVIGTCDSASSRLPLAVIYDCKYHAPTTANCDTAYATFLLGLTPC